MPYLKLLCLYSLRNFSYKFHRFLILATTSPISIIHHPSINHRKIQKKSLFGFCFFRSFWIFANKTRETKKCQQFLTIRLPRAQMLLMLLIALWLFLLLKMASWLTTFLLFTLVLPLSILAPLVSWLTPLENRIHFSPG